LYVTDEKYYAGDSILSAAIKSIQYIIENFYQAARLSMSLRDEDICLPPVFEKTIDYTLGDVSASLKQAIEKVSLSQVDADKKLLPLLQMINSLLTLSSYYFVEL